MDKQYGSILVGKLESVLKSSEGDRRVSGIIQQVGGYIAELEGELEAAVHDLQKLAEAASQEANETEARTKEVAALRQRIKDLEEANRKHQEASSPLELLSKLQRLKSELLKRGGHTSECPWMGGRDCYCGWEELQNELTGIVL